jgi:hypothetical protein
MARCLSHSNKHSRPDHVRILGLIDDATETDMIIWQASERNLMEKKSTLIPTHGNLFLPVRLLVWADGRGKVEQADSAARAELQGAPKQKLLQLKNIQKYHWVEHREMLICCLDVCHDM